MALTKQRQSKSRTRLRRAHDGLPMPGLCVCPNCNEPRQPHRICGYCGHYDGEKVLDLAPPASGTAPQD